MKVYTRSKRRQVKVKGVNNPAWTAQYLGYDEGRWAGGGTGGGGGEQQTSDPKERRPETDIHLSSKTAQKAHKRK